MKHEEKGRTDGRRHDPEQKRLALSEVENSTGIDPLLGWFRLGKKSEAYRTKRRKPVRGTRR